MEGVREGGRNGGIKAKKEMEGSRQRKKSKGRVTLKWLWLPPTVPWSASPAVVK